MSRLNNINEGFHLYSLCSQLRPQGTAVEPRSQEASLQAADEEAGERRRRRRGAGAGGGGRGGGGALHPRYDYVGVLVNIFFVKNISCNIEPHNLI